MVIIASLLGRSFLHRVLAPSFCVALKILYSAKHVWRTHVTQQNELTNFMGKSKGGSTYHPFETCMMQPTIYLISSHSLPLSKFRGEGTSYFSISFCRVAVAFRHFRSTPWPTSSRFTTPSRQSPMTKPTFPWPIWPINKMQAVYGVFSIQSPSVTVLPRGQSQKQW